MKLRVTSVNWRRGITLEGMERSNREAKTARGRHSYAVNGPEWGESDGLESGDSMEISQ